MSSNDDACTPQSGELFTYFSRVPPPQSSRNTSGSRTAHSVLSHATSGSSAQTSLVKYGPSTTPSTTNGPRSNGGAYARKGHGLFSDESDRRLFNRLTTEAIKCREKAAQLGPGSEATALLKEADSHLRYQAQMAREARRRRKEAEAAAASKSSQATSNSSTGSTGRWGRFAAKTAITGLVIGGVLCAATGAHPLDYVDPSYVDTARSGASTLMTGASRVMRGATSAVSSGASSLWSSAAPYASSIASGTSNVASGLWSGGSSVLSGASGYMSNLTGISAGAAAVTATCTVPAYPAFPEAATSALSAAPVVSEATRALCSQTGRLAASSGFVSYCSSMIPGWSQ